MSRRHTSGSRPICGRTAPFARAIALLCASKKGISSNQLHRMLGITVKSAWFMSHRIREAMRADGLMPPLGGAGGVVEIDETIYGRAATHPKGRRRKDAMLTNSAHKNVILALVERGGSVRSYHVAGSTVRQVIPIVQENVSREAAVMTDKGAALQIQARRLREP
jgi:hypothetical protein